jgi:ATP-dependent Clp protease ATP-binding subunit ClpC
MFERFTEQARQVVRLAHEEMRLLKHGYIDVEHLLLGLLREEEGLAARVLRSLGLTVEGVREELVRMVGRGEEAASWKDPFTGRAFTRRAKKALEGALRESLSLGRNYIATEHILLGLLRDTEGVAARILVEFGTDPAKIREEVMQMLSRPKPHRAVGDS